MTEHFLHDACLFVYRNWLMTKQKKNRKISEAIHWWEIHMNWSLLIINKLSPNRPSFFPIHAVGILVLFYFCYHAQFQMFYSISFHLFHSTVKTWAICKNRRMWIGCERGKLKKNSADSASHTYTLAWMWNILSDVGIHDFHAIKTMLLDNTTSMPINTEHTAHIWVVCCFHRIVDVVDGWYSFVVSMMFGFWFWWIPFSITATHGERKEKIKPKLDCLKWSNLKI